MSITSVISYGTVNIRSALSDGGSILHDLPLVKYLFFLNLRPESCTGLLEVSVSGRQSVRSSLSSRDRNQRGQLPMSECPGKQEMAKRHTHSCLLALAWVTVSPPLELHGHASLCQTQNDTELQVRWYTHIGQLWCEEGDELPAVQATKLITGGRCDGAVHMLCSGLTARTKHRNRNWLWHHDAPKMTLIQY